MRDFCCSVRFLGFVPNQLLNFSYQSHLHWDYSPKESHLRMHIETMADLDNQPWSAQVQEAARLLFREVLSWFPADLCCSCKQAEGDTVECNVCHRFFHEECDQGNMR